ncbi:MAG: anthranilate synthase component I family protein [Terrimicrobiaceae bacterium]|nr:anthranilate synthase component I family protein [Terrimicrobiaceae bacterium]
MNVRPAEPVSPIEAARQLCGRPGFVFLDSSLAGPESISLLASDPSEVLEGRDWALLEKAVASLSRSGPDLGYPNGAAIGHVAFDGSFRFGFYDQVFVYVHGDDRWITPPNFSNTLPRPPWSRIPFRPEIHEAEYIRMVERAREYIAAGDIYQVCLAHRFSAPGRFDAWSFYESLRHFSPAPHAAFLNAGPIRIASASPECFLRLSGRQIVTRPIKGTRPRCADPETDHRNARELTTSQKEAAELVMITDLERNDLGTVCEFGSVAVPDLLRLERFEQVFHLVSTVTGTLRPEISHVAALQSCFPGGSISGAPKKRALEIISELEPSQRGVYTGAIGYLGYNGESQFSIAIRTAVFESDIAHFHSGAGIVADSIPQKEWHETLAKASGLLRAAEPPVRILEADSEPIQCDLPDV